MSELNHVLFYSCGTNKSSFASLESTLCNYNSAGAFETSSKSDAFPWIITLGLEDYTDILNEEIWIAKTVAATARVLYEKASYPV